MSNERKAALAERDPQMLFLGDSADHTFDAALIGSVEIPCKGHVACYDYEKCVGCLMAANGWSREEALEWMEFNVVGGYVGEKGPVFFHPIEE
jgi:hypothetical protein